MAIWEVMKIPLKICLRRRPTSTHPLGGGNNPNCNHGAEQQVLDLCPHHLGNSGSNHTPLSRLSASSDYLA